MSCLGLLSDWFGDLLLIKHNEGQVINIQQTDVDDALEMLIRFVCAFFSRPLIM
jgi:hypothetical protein